MSFRNCTEAQREGYVEYTDEDCSDEADHATQQAASTEPSRKRTGESIAEPSRNPDLQRSQARNTAVVAYSRRGSHSSASTSVSIDNLNKSEDNVRSRTRNSATASQADTSG